MKPSLWSLAATLLALTPVQAQVSWQSHDGPWFARIDELAAGVSGGQTVVYAADSIDAEQTTGAILFKSTDGGAQWDRKYIAGATGYANCVATFSSDANIVYTGTFPYQGVFRSADGGDTWQEAGSLPNMWVVRITMHPSDPDALWVGCEEQPGPNPQPVLYRSTDGGASWRGFDIGGQQQTNRLSVSAIAVAGDTVWASTWGGQGGNDGIWRTLNGGETWTQEISGMNPENIQCASLAYDPNNPDVLFAGNRTSQGIQKLYRTQNGTAACEWDERYDIAPPDVSIADLSVDPQDSRRIYAATGLHGNGVGVLKSNDGGDTWQEVTDGLYGRRLRAVAVDPLSPDRVFTGGWGSCYRSEDGGETWTEKASGMLLSNCTSLAVKGPSLFAGGTDAPLARSTDSGTSWVSSFPPPYPLGVKSFAAALDPGDDQHVLVGDWHVETAERGSLWRTTNRGVSWSEVYRDNFDEAGITSIQFQPDNPNVVYATVGEGTNGVGVVPQVLKSTNRGQTWSSVLTIPLNGIDPDLRTVVVRSSFVYAGGLLPGGNVRRSTDAGSTWDTAATGLPGGKVVSLAMDPTNADVLYAATSSGVYRTVDRGENWSAASIGLLYTDVRFVCQNPRNPGFLYAVAIDGNGNGHTFKTTNGGVSWTEFATGLPQTALYQLAMDPTNPLRLYVGTAAGVHSADAPPAQPSGLGWTGTPGQHPTFVWTANTESDLAGYQIFRDGTRLNASLITTNSYIDSSIVVPQNGGGVVHFYTVSAVDNASNESARSPHATFEEGLQQGERPHFGGEAENRKPSGGIHVPAEFGLSQNYPNPFNPSTIISYSLESDGWAELSVFDILGREVQNLVHGLTKAGRHQVVFDAAHLAPGLYFCRLQASGATAVQKMLLVK